MSEHELKLYPPSEAAVKGAHVSGMAAYRQAGAPRPRPTTKATGRAWRASS